MTTLSTHVLDATLGRPATAMVVSLSGPEAGVLASTTTDADGRVHFEVALDAGRYSVRFSTGEWFAAAGRDTFFPEVTVAFEVPAEDAAEQPHLHVALLLSAYSYTTYRGS